MKELMRQCFVERGKTAMTAWLPQQFAVKGSSVDLKIRGQWEPCWVILEVYNQVILPADYVREHQRVEFGSLK